MRIEAEGKVIEKKQVSISEYSAGDYFPKEALTECLPFSIIADSPCEIISMPKVPEGHGVGASQPVLQGRGTLQIGVGQADAMARLQRGVPHPKLKFQIV